MHVCPNRQQQLAHTVSDVAIDCVCQSHDILSADFEPDDGAGGRGFSAEIVPPW